ncbi:MAG: Holliday junction branch migration protein RuvA [Lactobacillales bacterium]|jgi:Holliday junction DNA helicase RuvA|nr:Holliday junction branch migration protein RuvA [Lactobacillales bacterium]
MYEYFIGKMTFINPYYVVVEVAGVGYQILVGNPYSYSGKLEQEVKIFVYQAVREDAQTLYGFHSLDEKNLFLKLISVSGIGPKSALAIMAGEDHAGLIQAIATEDVTYLTKFPGVGKKTAQQMILDLQGKLGELETLPEVAQAMHEKEVRDASSGNNALDEALEALAALGYSDREIKRVGKGLAKDLGHQTDEYLRLGLKLMMKK